MKDIKENLSNKNDDLVGGCCVCSDDQGFSNNALVYCDGKDCTVACHTACYGIVSIPDGNWYCRRCEARAMKAPCHLCPLIEGAMKRTSDGDWAHVICALYIPEVSFGNDSAMEPIIISKIPSTRYGRVCSICIKNGRSRNEAMQGACCECSNKNCSKMFHITCAQQEGLLYEDVRKNTCQYPIYCHEHQPKFSKFIRQIPAFHYKDKNHSSDLSSQRFTQDNQTSQNLENKSISNDILSADNLSLKTSNLPKIKIEENTTECHSNTKKRSHPIDGPRRPVGRPPSKKKLNTKPVTPPPPPSLLPPPPQSSTQQQSSIQFYPRRPLTHSSSSSTTELPRSFPPETLEEFLEQEWQSSSDFLLQQTMPHDVSSLLSCLYQFKTENASLEKQYEQLKHRRDNLRLTNANLRRKITDVSSLTTIQQNSTRLPTKISSTDIDHLSRYSTSLDTMIKNERVTPTNGLSLELLSQILTTSGPQLFAPTWNISNFGYANFPGANSISLTDDSLLRSYSSFEQ